MQQFEHGGNIYKAASLSGITPTALLDYSANINPLGLAESIQTAIMQGIENIIHYPDADAEELKQAVSVFYKVKCDTITMGNGADELLYLFCNIAKPKRILVCAPTFSEYERAGKSAGAVVDFLQLRSENCFRLDVEELIAKLPSVCF